MVKFLVLINILVEKKDEQRIERSYKYVVDINYVNNLIERLEGLEKIAESDYDKNYNTFQKECFATVHQVMKMT